MEGTAEEKVEAEQQHDTHEAFMSDNCRSHFFKFFYVITDTFNPMKDH